MRHWHVQLCRWPAGLPCALRILPSHWCGAALAVIALRAAVRRRWGFHASPLMQCHSSGCCPLGRPALLVRVRRGWRVCGFGGCSTTGVHADTHLDWVQALQPCATPMASWQEVCCGTHTAQRTRCVPTHCLAWRTVLLGDEHALRAHGLGAHALCHHCRGAKRGSWVSNAALPPPLACACGAACPRNALVGLAALGCLMPRARAADAASSVASLVNPGVYVVASELVL